MLRITRELVVVTAVLAFGCASEAFGQDPELDSPDDRRSLLEAAASATGASYVSVIPYTWDDIPLVPFPAEFTEEAEPFPLTPFTLTNTLRTTFNQAMQRTAPLSDA